MSSVFALLPVLFFKNVFIFLYLVVFYKNVLSYFFKSYVNISTLKYAYINVLTQSKSKTIITRSMLTISLIVFTDKFKGHVHTFYTK